MSGGEWRTRFIHTCIHPPTRAPSCVLQKPLKTEGNELASTAIIDFEIACLGESSEIRRFFIRSFLHSCSNANVHTEPPVGTMLAPYRVARIPPKPDATVTYWRPLCV